jgi:hypothetical protein
MARHVWLIWVYCVTGILFGLLRWCQLLMLIASLGLGSCYFVLWCESPQCQWQCECAYGLVACGLVDFRTVDAHIWLHVHVARM